MKVLFLILVLCVVSGIYAQGPVPFKLAPIAEKAQILHDSTYFLQTTGWAKNDSVEYEKYITLNNYLDSLLAMANYMQILNKYNLGKYYESVNNNFEAIKCYKEILRFPFWGYYHNYKFEISKNLSFNNIYYNLYISSGTRIIGLYQKNRSLDELIKLKFVPATFNSLMPILKSAIENLGGDWPYKDMIFDTSYLFNEEMLRHIHDPQNIQNSSETPKEKD